MRDAVLQQAQGTYQYLRILAFMETVDVKDVRSPTDALYSLFGRIEVERKTVVQNL